MIKIYCSNIEEIENGYLVYLQKWDSETDESRVSEKHAFVGIGARDRAFDFGKMQLGEEVKEEVKY